MKTLFIITVLLACVLSLDCADGKILVTVTRTYGTLPQEERFYIYEGVAMTGDPVYALVGVIGDTSKIDDVCLSPVIHTLQLTDVTGNGWPAPSEVVLSAGGVSLGSYTLTSGATITFPVSISNIYLHGGAWKHSNEAQIGTSWTTQSVSWTEGIVFPVVTTTTRYFRRTLTITSPDDVFAIVMSVKTNTGFLLYMNGNLVWNWNMPTQVTSSTYALSSTVTAIEQVYSTLSKLVFTSGTVEVAIEVHATATTMSGDETFSGQLIFGSGGDKRRIDNAGTVTASHVGLGAESTAMIFDGLTSTKWCFYHYGEIVWTRWTFSNGRREMINRYSISTANDFSVRDPVAWNVYGSFDGITFNLLGSESGVLWTGRMQTKTFDMNNYIAYNSYKLEITQKAGVDVSMQFSEWNLMISNIPIVPLAIQYYQSSFSLYAGVSVLDIKPSVTGFINWTIMSTIPSGLTLDSDNGRISGTPDEVKSVTSYTVSATHISNGQSYTTILTITVLDCSLPVSMFVSFSKSNSNSITETYKVFDSSNNLVLDGVPGSQSQITNDMCLPVGIYTVKLLQSSGSVWQTSSMLTVTFRTEGVSFTTFKSRLLVNTEASFPLVVNYVLPSARSNTNIKYIADGTVPANWFSASFDSSSWTTLQHASRPSVSQTIQLFRSTFNMASVTEFSGYEFNVKAKAGVVVYINGQEIYRRYVIGDVSSSSTATGGLDNAYWRAVTGKIGHLNQGMNTVAVAVVNLSGVSEAIAFDFSLRLMKDSNDFPRNWDFTATSNSGVADSLFDQNPSTRLRFSKSAAFVTIQYLNVRADYVNRYCLTSNYDSAAEDPRNWTIQGSNNNVDWDLLKTETNVVFEQRSTQYCFYMPLVTKAYTLFKFIPTATAEATATFYGLAEISLYLEDLDHAVVPDLSFIPSVLVSYTGDSFPEVSANSKYYSAFTISPALPSGLTLNSNSGGIRGIANQPQSATIHTVSAMNHLGLTKTTTISVAVETCSGDKVSFSLSFSFQTGASKCSFDLKDLSTGQVVESRPYFNDNQITTIPMCRTAQKYALVLKKTDTTGWGANRVTVRLADGAELLTESLATGVTSKEYAFNIRYEIEPMYSSWNYKVDGAAAPAGWNTVKDAPAWPTATPTTIPAATGVTHYYYKKFTMASLSDYSAMEISVVSKAGLIIYLNGKVVYSIHMPESEVNEKTEAIKEETVPITFTVGVITLSGQFIEGENIIAFELHRYRANEVTNSFDGSAILILNNMYMIKDGVGTTIPSSTGLEGSDKVFDNNSDTKFLYASKCVGVVINWVYNNNRREPISNYGLVSANDCNSRHPSGWTFQASNDGVKWDTLHIATNVVFITPHQQKRFDFYNQKAYNRYKVTTTACQNVNFPGDSSQWCAGPIQLADFYLFSKRVEPDCPRDGDFHPAMIDSESTAECPEMYEGVRTKLCLSTGWSVETNLCKPKAPQSITYPLKSLELVQGTAMTPMTPVIVGIETKVNCFPTLPKGLSIDRDTGTISGTPLEPLEFTNFSISATNVNGSKIERISIVIAEKPTNWLLIIIIAVVAIVVIVGIIIVISAISKKNKKNPAKAPSRKSSKAMAKTGSTKTKGVVKV